MFEEPVRLRAARAGEIRLKLNAHTEWYYGNHEGDDKGECHGILIQGRQGSVGR